MHKTLRVLAGLAVAAFLVVSTVAFQYNTSQTVSQDMVSLVSSLTSTAVLSEATSVKGSTPLSSAETSSSATPAEPSSVEVSSQAASSLSLSSVASTVTPSSVASQVSSSQPVTSSFVVSSKPAATSDNTSALVSNKVFDEYTKAHVKKLRDTLGTGSDMLVLTLMTDSHEHPDMLRTTAANISAVNRQVPSAALIHLGDIIDGNKVKADSLKILDRSMTTLTSMGLPVMLARGNHDDNSYQPDKTFNSIINNEEWYQHTQKVTDGVEGIVRQDHSPNFYRDLPQSKVRLIILSYDNGNPGDSPDELSGINGKTYWGFDFNTVYWLGKVALQNLPEGWQVAVFSHFPARKELCAFSKQPVNGLQVEGILQAFTQGSIYIAKDLSGGAANEQSFSFEKQGKRSIIGFFYGHNHADLIMKPAGVSFTYISTANSFGSAQADQSILPPGSTVPFPRTFGTVNENCWDNLVVDTEKRTVKIFRYGAGNDRMFSYE